MSQRIVGGLDLEDQVAAIVENLTEEQNGVPPALTIGVQGRRSDNRVGASLLKPMAADEFIAAEHEIAAKLGPGRYYLVVRQLGRSGTVQRLDWDVEGMTPPQVPTPPPAPTFAPSPPMAGVPSGPLDMGTMLLAIIQSSAQQQQAASAAAAQQNAAMMQGFMSMATAMMNKPTREPTPLSDMMEFYERMERKGRGGGDDGDDGVASAVLRALPDLLGRLPAADARQIAAAPPPPPPTLSPPPAGAEPPAALTRDAVIAEFIRRRHPAAGPIAAQVADLVVTAGRMIAVAEARDQDPAETAALVVDFIGADVAEGIAAGADDLPDLIRLADGRISAEYARRVADAIPAALEDDPDTDTEPDTDLDPDTDPERKEPADEPDPAERRDAPAPPPPAARRRAAPRRDE